LYNQVIK